MELLVLGANGLLGSNVVFVGGERGCNVSGTYHSREPSFDVPLTKFDFLEPDSFDDVLEVHEPDVVVNCAAMTDVDACEQQPERAHRINGDAPGRLAESCEEAGVDFVHVSTDYVFDGEATEPYDETADPNPVQAYGETKLAGEWAVQEAAEGALLARISFVWGIHRGGDGLSGFPAWVRDRIASGESTPLFTDQWITPTRAGNAAEVILDLVEAGMNGLYNVACSSCVTPREFGEIIVDVIEASPKHLEDGRMSEVDRSAARPSYTCLDVGKVEAALERTQPTLREDVECILAES